MTLERWPATALALALATGTGDRSAVPPLAAQLPARVGACAFTSVRRVEQRLEDGAGPAIPGSGSAVALADSGYGASNEEVPAANRARRGDRAATCFTRLLRHCSTGDDRGRWSINADLRADEAWMAPHAVDRRGDA